MKKMERLIILKKSVFATDMPSADDSRRTVPSNCLLPNRLLVGNAKRDEIREAINLSCESMTATEINPYTRLMLPVFCYTNQFLTCLANGL